MKGKCCNSILIVPVEYGLDTHKCDVVISTVGRHTGYFYRDRGRGLAYLSVGVQYHKCQVILLEVSDQESIFESRSMPSAAGV